MDISKIDRMEGLKEISPLDDIVMNKKHRDIVIDILKRKEINEKHRSFNEIMIEIFKNKDSKEKQVEDFIKFLKNNDSKEKQVEDFIKFLKNKEKEPGIIDEIMETKHLHPFIEPSMSDIPMDIPYSTQNVNSEMMRMMEGLEMPN